MVTPFDHEGNVDYDLAASVARYLVENGSDGLVVAGSTGEGGSLSDEEKLSLFRCVAEAVTVPVLAGSTSGDTARSVVLSREAASSGVSGILVTTPAYSRPSQRGIEAHFTAIAAASHLPVMLYDIPARTGRKVSAATTIAVARNCPNVLALKDASGDLPSAAQVKQTLGDGFDLYAGDDDLVLPFFSIGATGLVSVASHWAGPQYAALISAVDRNDWSLARVINDSLAPSCQFEGNEMYPNPQPAKAALRLLGMAVGQCRAPLGASDAALDNQAAEVLTGLHVARG